MTTLLSTLCISLFCQMPKMFFNPLHWGSFPVCLPSLAKLTSIRPALSLAVSFLSRLLTLWSRFPDLPLPDADLTLQTDSFCAGALASLRHSGPFQPLPFWSRQAACRLFSASVPEVTSVCPHHLFPPTLRGHGSYYRLCLPGQPGSHVGLSLQYFRLFKQSPSTPQGRNKP